MLESDSRSINRAESRPVSLPASAFRNGLDQTKGSDNRMFLVGPRTHAPQSYPVSHEEIRAINAVSDLTIVQAIRDGALELSLEYADRGRSDMNAASFVDLVRFRALLSLGWPDLTDPENMVMVDQALDAICSVLDSTPSQSELFVVPTMLCSAVFEALDPLARPCQQGYSRPGNQFGLLCWISHSVVAAWYHCERSLNRLAEQAARAPAYPGFNTALPLDQVAGAKAMAGPEWANARV